ACNKAEAARRAGCSVKRAKSSAWEWFRNPEVKLEIDRQLAQKTEGRIEVLAKTSEKLTPEDVIRELDSIEETCKLAGAGAWQVATRVKVAELKGKWLKMWTDKIEVGPNDALMELLLEGRKRAGLGSVVALPSGGPDGSVQ